MNVPGLRRAVPAIACAISVPALAAAPAQALTTHTATTSTTNGNGELVATAHCAPGEHVVSGGYSDSPEGAAVVSKAVGGDSWTVHTYPGTGGTLMAAAYCSGGNGRIRTASARENLRDSQTHTLKAKCSGEESVAVSGGFAFGNEGSQSNSPTFKSVLKGTRKWAVSAVFASPPAPLKTFVYCEKGADVKVRSDLSDPITEDANEFTEVSCHPGEQLLGGGYATTPTPDWDNDTGPDLFFFQSFRSGARTWRAGAINYSPVTGRIQVFAYCAA